MTLRTTFNLPTGGSQNRDQRQHQQQQQQTQKQTQQHASSTMSSTTPNPSSGIAAGPSPRTATSTSTPEIATTPPFPHPPTSSVTLLILGAGWTYQFLHPLLSHHHNITHAATTTTGRDGTIPFKFDPDSDSYDQYKALPQAKYVLITFPLKGVGQSAKLVTMYNETHHTSDTTTTSSASSRPTKWIQLGSTGIFTAADWNDSSSPIDESNTRGVAECELIEVANGCVLNLAGLYGASRNPRNWVSRVAKTKDQLAQKGAVHLIHGEDVARAVVGVILKDMGQEQSPSCSSLFGRRWIVADCVSYDWWSLVWDWMGESNERDTETETERSRTSQTVETVQTPASDEQQQQGEDTSKTTTEADAHTNIKRQYRQWILELMEEHNIRGLPRSMDQLGRKLDAREFWEAVGSLPTRSLAR